MTRGPHATQKHMRNLPAPAQKPSSGHPKLPTSAVAAIVRQPVYKSPSYARLIAGKEGVQSGAAFPIFCQPKSCSDCLDPRDGSTSSIASERLAPRAQRKPADPVGTFSKARLYIIKCMQMIARNSSTRILIRPRRRMPRKVRTAASSSATKAADPENVHISRVLTGSRLL